MEPCDKDKGCAKRQKIAAMSKTGVLTVINRCSEPKAEFMGQDVGALQCNTCPFRVDVPKLPIVITAVVEDKPAPKRNIVLIDNSEGYPPCDDRRIQTVIKCCGQVEMRKVCASRVCEYNGKEVSKDVCASCPLRVVNGVAINTNSKGS